MSLLAASTPQRLIGFTVLIIVFLGFVVWAIANVRDSRREVGSEIELAANRKPYFTDEELEGKKLNWALFSAVGLLMVIGVALPLYWLAEPGRQEGAVEVFRESFEKRGLSLYEVGAQCVACHGPKGAGGVASFAVNDENGNFVSQVTWDAPALDTVLWRFSEDEVRFILNYGRPGTPMAAWGAPGGGPLTTQQIDNIIDYLWTVQASEEDMREDVHSVVSGIDPELGKRLIAVDEANAKITDPTKAARLSFEDELRVGEILFNNTDSGAGAYSCARCHVAGAAYGQGGTSFGKLQYGSLGPDLKGIESQATEKQHFNLIWNGQEIGKGYFSRRIGVGTMPGYGANPNTGKSDKGVPDLGPNGMYTPAQVWAVVTYERNLSSGRAYLGADAGTAESPTFTSADAMAATATSGN